MAARANWKGYLKVALVTCEVALYPVARQGERVSFNKLNRSTGNRLHQRYVDAVTDEVVAAEDQVRGYQVGPDTYVQVEDHEFDAVKVDGQHTIDVTSFVRVAEVDRRYLDTSYYVTAADRVGIEAFLVFRDAMRAKGVAGLGTVVVNRRERHVLVEPWEGGMMATTLKFDHEIWEPQGLMGNVSAGPAATPLVEIAERLIDTRMGSFDPSTFGDRVESGIVELLRRKAVDLAGATDPNATMPPEQPSPPPSPTKGPATGAGLMDLLRQSLAAILEELPPRRGRRRGSK